MYFINHSETTYPKVWLATSFPYEEEDSDIWPIAGHSVTYLWTVARRHIHSPYIFDIYEQADTKLTTLIAHISDADLHRNKIQSIALLNQNGWIINLEQVTPHESHNAPIIISHNLNDMSDEELNRVADELFDKLEDQRSKSHHQSWKIPSIHNPPTPPWLRAIPFLIQKYGKKIRGWWK